MKKILLIDDRLKRQEDFLTLNDIVLTEYEDGAKPRFETVMKVLDSFGVKLQASA